MLRVSVQIGIHPIHIGEESIERPFIVEDILVQRVSVASMSFEKILIELEGVRGAEDIYKIVPGENIFFLAVEREF